MRSPPVFSEPFEPISLGYACEVKYQLSRAVYFRQHPDGVELDLRRMLLTPEYGQRTFERHIFDWQITPFEAVLEYLEADFQGVFERADLAPAEDGSGEVEHRRLKTRHPHDFHAVDGVLDHKAIDAQYETARSKFDYLAGKFRRLIREETPQLYVFRQIRIHDEAVRLIRLLGGGRLERKFKLLFVGFGGEDQNLTALEGQVFKAWAPLEADKPADRQWEGDDASWDRVLADFPLRLPGRRLTRTFDESLQPFEPEPAAPSARKGWLAALFGRRSA